MIEVRYAGVVVGRSAIIRELDTRGLFLGITEPMPVGTPVTLRIGDRAGTEDVLGKVELVSESQELAHAGMRVRFADPRAAVLFGTPSEAPPEAPEPEPVAVAVNPAGASTAEIASGAAPDQVVAGAVIAAPVGHRRIVVDASAEKAREAAAPESRVESQSHTGSDAADAADAADDGDLSGAAVGDTGRIAAPDPSAFGGPGGAGKKGRRTRRR